jgi:hypothetical protein
MFLCYSFIPFVGLSRSESCLSFLSFGSRSRLAVRRFFFAEAFSARRILLRSRFSSAALVYFLLHSGSAIAGQCQERVLVLGFLLFFLCSSVFTRSVCRLFLVVARQDTCAQVFGFYSREEGVGRAPMSPLLVFPPHGSFCFQFFYPVPGTSVLPDFLGAAEANRRSARSSVGSIPFGHIKHRQDSRSANRRASDQFRCWSPVPLPSLGFFVPGSCFCSLARSSAAVAKFVFSAVFWLCGRYAAWSVARGYGHQIRSRPVGACVFAQDFSVRRLFYSPRQGCVLRWFCSIPARVGPVLI